jgi:hypothetical protein
MAELSDHRADSLFRRHPPRKVISLGEKITLEVRGFGVRRGDGRRVVEGGQESFLPICEKRAEKRGDLSGCQALGNGHGTEINLSLDQVLEDVFGADGREESVFARFDLPGSKKELVGG